DLHLRSTWWPAYDELIARVAQNVPDLILITGDFADNRRDASPQVPTIRRLVGALRARLGVFGVLGNHDVALPPGALDGLGLQLLDGRAARVHVDANHGLELIGFPGIHSDLLTDEVLGSYPP